jgi:hypothetical protein
VTTRNLAAFRAERDRLRRNDRLVNRGRGIAMPAVGERAVLLDGCTGDGPSALMPQKPGSRGRPPSVPT